MNVDIFIRPQEAPVKTIEDRSIRIYYNGQWVDFRDGKISITGKEDGKSKKNATSRF